MATYSKGFKKQTSEQILLQVIVGIVVAVVVIVGLAFLYDTLTVTRSYDDFTKIDTFENLLIQKDADTNQIQDYILYFYSDACTSCESIKDDSLKLASKIQKNGIPVFFVDTANMTDEADFKVPFLTTINESSLRTPMICVVHDGVYSAKFIGTDQVTPLLESVVDGTYEPFN